MIPNIVWQPHAISERFKEEPVESNPNPFRSSYQADFDSPSILKVNSRIFNKEINDTKPEFNNLNELRKRRDQIDQALLKLNS